MWDKRLVLFDSPIPEGHEHCPYITELLELQAKQHSKYLTTVEAPNVKGKHDDMSDALVRMVWLASQQLGKPIYFAKGGRGNRPPRNQPAHLRRKLMRSGSHESRQVDRSRGPKKVR